MTSGIYQIKHNESGKVYVGSSKNIEGRWRTHRYDLNRNAHHCTHLQHAWNKYSGENFSFSVLEECSPTREVLIRREQFYLDTLRPEYNRLQIAGSRLGSKTSQETKDKQSAALKGKNLGKTRSPEQRSRLSELARNMSAETREKMSAAKRGRKLSDETRKKMSESHRGRKHTEEATAKMIEAKLAKRQDKILETTSLLQNKTLTKNDCRPTFRRIDIEVARTIRYSAKIARELSTMYGVSETTVNKIKRGLIYKDAI